ncbi:hypothetical protein ACVNF4_03970 [Streptomyces sp. S6]
MRFIGFYREMSPGDSELYAEKIPTPHSGVLLYPLHEVSRYLTSGHPVLDVMEVTEDAIDGSFRCPGGSSVLTDGHFVWRLDLASYVQHHVIALPQDFLEFAAECEYSVPTVKRERLIEISLAVENELGFRADPGAGPRPAR